MSTSTSASCGSASTRTASPPCGRAARSGSRDAVDADIFDAAVAPVIAATETLDATVIATSEVALDGTRTSVRGVESNEGNLIADALRWQATQLADDFGVAAPDVALQNGGGIRNNTVIEAGDITLLDTFDMVPFPNFVTVLEGIPRDQFKEILENAYSRGAGRRPVRPDLGLHRFVRPGQDGPGPQRRRHRRRGAVNGSRT